MQLKSFHRHYSEVKNISFLFALLLTAAVFIWKSNNFHMSYESTANDGTIDTDAHLRESFDQYDNELWHKKHHDQNMQAKVETTLDDEYIAEWDQSDPRLIEHIRQRYLHRPTDTSVPYNLSTEKLDYSLYGASLIANKTLGGQKSGFFVECGAADGEEQSNTLMFERYMGWTGLLIEPQPDNFKRLQSRNRKSWLVNGCIHGHSKPKTNIIHGKLFSSVLDSYVDEKRRSFNAYAPDNSIKAMKVWCFPLLSLLLAINQTSIDYFPLDVEGAEYDILKNLPFDKISIKLLQIEWVRFEEPDEQKQKNRMRMLENFMEKEHPEFKEVSKTPMDIFYKSTKCAL